mmetsp:Transcript_10249/g.15734  ORF Transcript_10249/g.15734 Transcript_10249/m.15734 type:complete len:441 (+) Transcript_10249:62-1384(+)
MAAAHISDEAKEESSCYCKPILVVSEDEIPRQDPSGLELLQQNYQQTRDVLDQLADGVRIVTRQIMKQSHDYDNTNEDSKEDEARLNDLTLRLDGSGFGADLVGLILAAQTLGGCARLAGKEAAVATDDYQKAREMAERCKNQTRQACLMARKLHDENRALEHKLKRSNKEKKALVGKIKSLIEVNDSLKERQNTRVALEQYVCDALEVHESQLLLPRRRKASGDMIILEESVVWEEAEEDCSSAESKPLSPELVEPDVSNPPIEKANQNKEPSPSRNNIFRDIFMASASTSLPQQKIKNVSKQEPKVAVKADVTSPTLRNNSKIKKLEPKLSLTSDATTVTTAPTKSSLSFDDKENVKRKQDIFASFSAGPSSTLFHSTPSRRALVPPPSVTVSTSSHVMLSPLDTTSNSSPTPELLNCDEKVLRSLALPQDDGEVLCH